jgi:drug/metabolite transporter (DMT)-like permease
VAAYFEQAATKRVRGDQDVPASQWGALIKKPRWLGGQLADVTAFGLTAVALAFGGLILVEPLLVMSLPFAVGLRIALRHEHPRRREVLGSLLCVGGLGLFLLFARPRPGTATPTLADVWPAALGLAVAVGASLALALRTHDNWRAIGFALAAAGFLGVTGASVRIVMIQLHGGIVRIVTHWSLYTAILCGLVGVVFVQNALKPGALAAPVAVFTVGNPLVGVVLGLLWLDEKVTTTWPALIAESAGIAAVVCGVVVLAGESPAASAEGGDDHTSRKNKQQTAAVEYAPRAEHQRRRGSRVRM